MQEVLRLDELGQNRAAVVGGVSGAVGDGAVVIDKAHETRVLDAVALIVGDGEEDALAEGELGGEAQLVIRVGEPLDALERAFRLMGERQPLAPHTSDAHGELAAREFGRERVHDGGGAFVVEAHLVQLDHEALFAIAGVRHHLRKTDETRHGREFDVSVW